MSFMCWHGSKERMARCLEKGRKCRKFFPIPFTPLYTYACMCVNTHSTVRYMYSKTSSLYCSLDLYGIYLLFIDLATTLWGQRLARGAQTHLDQNTHTRHCQNLLWGFCKHNMAELCLGQVSSIWSRESTLEWCRIPVQV